MSKYFIMFALAPQPHLPLRLLKAGQKIRAQSVRLKLQIL